MLLWKAVFFSPALLLAATAAALAQPAATSRVSGSVIGDDGKPMAGATVTYRKLATFTKDARGRMVKVDPGLAGSISTGGDGAFTSPLLPAGDYHICAFGPRPTQVSDCAWDGVGVVAVAQGQTLNGLIRRVHEGSTLTIHVSDPNNLIDLPDASGRVTRSRRFVIGVHDGAYVRADPSPGTASLKQFQLIIPKQRAFRLFIDTQANVFDIAGNAIEVRSPTSLQVSSASNDSITLNLRVK